MKPKIEVNEATDEEKAYAAFQAAVRAKKAADRLQIAANEQLMAAINELGKYAPEETEN